MSSAICFNLDQSKILSSDNGLKKDHSITCTYTTVIGQSLYMLILGQQKKQISIYM